MQEINVHEGIGFHPPKPFVKKKVEQTVETVTEEKTEEKKVSFMDVMPYPQFFIGFAIGAFVIAYASNWYFESKYGPVMEALPAFEQAREKADANDAKIRSLVEENAKHAKTMEDSANKIVEWAKRLEPKKQAVVNK